MKDSRDYSKSLDRSRSKSRSVSREAAPRPKPTKTVATTNDFEEEVDRLGDQTLPSRPQKHQRPQTAKPEPKKQAMPTFKMKYQDDDFEEAPQVVGDQHVNRPQTAHPKKLKPLDKKQPKVAFKARPANEDFGDFEEEELGQGDQNIGPNTGAAVVAEPYVPKERKPLYNPPASDAPKPEKPAKKGTLSAAEIEAQRQNQQKASSQFDALLKEKKNKQSKGDAFMDL